MKYRVKVTRRAEDELFEIAAWIALDSPLEASRWLDRMQAALERLAEYPERCPLAPEGERDLRRDIRHLLVGDYRALFALRAGSVQVLLIRHASRIPASSEDLERAREEEEPPRCERVMAHRTRHAA